MWDWERVGREGRRTSDVRDESDMRLNNFYTHLGSPPCLYSMSGGIFVPLGLSVCTYCAHVHQRHGFVVDSYHKMCMRIQRSSFFFHLKLTHDSSRLLTFDYRRSTPSIRTILNISNKNTFLADNILHIIHWKQSGKTNIFTRCINEEISSCRSTNLWIRWQSGRT